MKIIILVEMATALTFVCEIPETGKLHNAEAAGGTRSGKESRAVKALSCSFLRKPLYARLYDLGSCASEVLYLMEAQRLVLLQRCSQRPVPTPADRPEPVACAFAKPELYSS